MKIFIAYKKSILTSIGFLFLITIGLGQDLSKIQQLLDAKEYARAKEAVDSTVLLYDTSAAAFLLKAAIYNAISNDGDARYLVPDARQEAFAALQKAGQLNMNYVTEKQKATNYSLPVNLYNGYTNGGLLFFNTGVEQHDKASYQRALGNFKNAGQVSQYMYSNGWGFSFVDTLNLYYCSKAAINADDETAALIYCKRMIDNRIITAGNNSCEIVYQWLVYYYKQKQEETNFIKYTEAGVKAFPRSSYFMLIYIDWYRQERNYTQLFDQYQQLFKKEDAASNRYQLAYYNDIFNFLYTNNTDTADPIKYKNLLTKGLTEYVKRDPANTAARLLLGKFYINQAVELNLPKLLRTTKSAIIINDYNRAAYNYYKQSNVHLLAIVNKFAGSDRVIYKEALQLLIANYKVLKMDKERRKYQAMIK
jgi:hypothetical protein